MDPGIIYLLQGAKAIAEDVRTDVINRYSCWDAAKKYDHNFVHLHPDRGRLYTKMYISEDLQILIRQHSNIEDLLKALMLNVELKSRLSNGLGKGAIKKELKIKAWLRKLSEVKKQLEHAVIGQDDAIEAICNNLASKAYRREEAGPAGVLLFVGPTATGKTLSSKTLATALSLGDDWSYTSVQMENMTGRHDGFEIFGLAKGWHAHPGKVAEFVREYPKSVVVFENFDRASIDVQNRLLDMLNRGIMTDDYYASFNPFRRADSLGDDSDSIGYRYKDPEVSFKQAIVVFTSNSDVDLYENPQFQSLIQQYPEQLQSIILNALGKRQNEHGKKAVSSSLIQGLASGSTVFFRKLGLEALGKCAEQNFEKGAAYMEEDFGLEVTCKYLPDIAKAMVMNLAPEVNALVVNNALLNRLFDPILDCLRQNDGAISKVHIRFARGQQKKLKEILVSFNGKDVIQEMFRKNNTLNLTLKGKRADDKLILEIGSLAIEPVNQAHDFVGIAQCV